MDCDVVKQEDPSCGKRVRVGDAPLELGFIEFFNDFASSDILRLDTGDCKHWKQPYQLSEWLLGGCLTLLLLGQPFCGFRPIGQREERDERQTTGDDAFDQEDLAPASDATNICSLENCSCKQAWFHNRINQAK